MSNLIEAARTVRDRAYAPYSGYKVGASVLDAEGRIWTGCNVENVAFPSSMCAERNAVAAMIAGGGTKVVEVAVATRDGGSPCGGCLQVLFEFADRARPIPIHAVDEQGEVLTFTLVELMPHVFCSDDVTRTER